MTGTQTDDKPARSLKPRDAATLIMVDRSGPPRILMGRRRATQIFLPNKFVFPGGRVDRIDRSIPAASELGEADQDKLLIDMKGSAAALPMRARGMAMAALRETYEETGVLIGQPHDQAAGGEGEAFEKLAATADAGQWRGFFAERVVPALAPMRFLARAITPPGRTRRYDTRFFVADAQEIVKRVPPPDDELSDVDWYAIDEVRRLDLPNITRAIVEDLNEFLDADAARQQAWPVPFYYFKAGSFERVLLG